MLEEGADLGARRRLAGAQEDRHRLAAVYMVDVDGKQAARVIMGVEQRQPLVDVHRTREELERQHEAPNRLGEKTSTPARHANISCTSRTWPWEGLRLRYWACLSGRESIPLATIFSVPSKSSRKNFM